MKKSLSVILILVALLLGYLVGNGTATTELDGAKADLETVQKKVESSKDEKKELEKEITDTQSELDGLGSELDEAKAVINNRSDIEKEIEKLKKEQSNLKSENGSLDSKIDKKEKELSLLTGQVREAEAKPINMSAGKFTVGEDIKSGRYKVSTTYSSSNYVVNEGGKANIILGTEDGFSVNDYVIELEDGDKIECDVPVTYKLLK